MGKFLARQLLLFVPTVLLLTFLVFGLIHFFLPGDPATAFLGQTASPEAIEAFRKKMRLDEHFLVQYGTWLGNLLKGDLGKSIRTGEPVLRVVVERLPVTIQLAAYSLVLGTVVGVPLGVAAALRRNTVLDLGVQVLGLAGLSLPGFFLAVLLILLLAIRWSVLPVAGYVSLGEDAVAHVRSLIMPSLALSFTTIGMLSRMTRASVLEVLRENYVTTARAKGLAGRIIIVRHVLRNALIPIITLIGLELGFSLGGTVVIERIFGLPGVGRLLIDSINGQDLPLVQGVVLFLAVVRLLINLLTDLAYALVDPTVRFQ